jgi:hypothetical protein
MELSIIEKTDAYDYEAMLSDDEEGIFDNYNELVEKKGDSANNTSVSTVFENVKTISDHHFFIKILIWFILLNPFIKMLLKLLNNKYFDCNAIDKLLTQKEKQYLNIATIIILLAINLLIMLCVHDYAFRAIAYFINNIYLLLFVIDVYHEK